jgi:iron complex outermembrane receptor protein
MTPAISTYWTRVILSGRAALIIVCGFGISLVHAQGLEEVLVTAQKREQAISDVGIAITAFTGDQLDNLGWVDSTKIAQLAAGVDISAGGGGQNQQFVIRGASLNEFNENVEGTTAIYLDEGYIANIGAGIFGMYDIERVEILKGPQGTLFGRNATAGLVHYVSRAPTEELEGYADLTVGDFDLVNFQGAISGPLGENVRGRAAVYYRTFDELYNNKYPRDAVGGPPPDGGGQDHWNDNTIAGRLRLDWDINENVSVELMGHAYSVEQGENPYQQLPTVAVFDEGGTVRDVLVSAPDELREGIGPNGEAIDVNGDGNPFRPVAGGDFFGYVDPDGPGRDLSKDWAYDDKSEFDFYGFMGKLNWELDNGIALTAISDYKYFDRIQTTDVDAGPVNQLVYEQITDGQWQFSQEIRLNGETQNTRWVGGLYYLTIDSRFINGFMIVPGSLFIPFAPPGIPAGEPWDAPNDQELETDSYSLFGQLEYDLTDQLTLIAGARVIREEKDFNLTSLASVSTDLFKHDTDAVFFFPTFAEDPCMPACSSFSDDYDKTLWAGKIQLDWKPNDDWLVYLGLNRGVKAGNFNAPLPLTGPPLPAQDIGYDEEELLALELGFKTTAFDGRAQITGAAYYYDYTDYHNFSFVSVSSIVTNQDATNVGVELDIAATPVDGLDIITGFSWFDFEVEDVVLAPGFVRDSEPTYSPDFTWHGLGRYEWPLAGGRLAVQLDANYRSSFFTNVNNFSANEIDDTWLANASASFTTADDAWQFTLFVNNFTDEENEIIKFDLATLCGCNEVAYTTPRWWGARLRYSFR